MTVIKWIVSSSALILFVTLLRHLLRGKIALRLQYALWGLVLIRLLVPVSFGESPLSVMHALPDVSSQTVVPEAMLPDTHVFPPAAWESPPLITGHEASPGHDVPHGASVPKDRGSAVKVVWLGGAAVISLFFLTTNLRFFARLRKNRYLTDMGGYPLPVYVSRLVETPCMFGLFHPAIYVTEEVMGNPTVLRCALEHETTHYYHMDHIWAALRGVCLALHWYNPLVWLAATLSLHDAELACDESTVERMGERSRLGYGSSLIGLTSGKHCAGGLLNTATTMTGSKKNIKERVMLISKKQKMAPYTISFVVLAVALAACSTFSGAGSNETIRFTVSLDSAPLHSPQGITVLSSADDSDITEVFEQAQLDGTRAMFYRAKNGDIWGAWEKDGSVHRFIAAYYAQEGWGYQDGFSVETFEGLFGHRGFVMGCPVGATYTAYDYCFFNEDGKLERLAQSVNDHRVIDLDKSGDPELLYFSYEGAGLAPHFFFQRDGHVYKANVFSHLYSAFLGWTKVWSLGTVSEDDGGIYLPLGFRLGDDEAEYECKVRFAGSHLEVDVPKSAVPTDGAVWLLRQKGYEVGLRDAGEKTELIMRRGKTVTILESLQSNSGTGWRYTLQSFGLIPELSGFVLGNVEVRDGWGNYYYYAADGDSATCFAQSSGFGISNIPQDLDGDGMPELICNVTYGDDGARDVLVYTVKGGVFQVASVSDSILPPTHLGRLAHASVQTKTGLVTLEYFIATEDGFRVETAPIVYDSLRFEDFVPAF